MSVHIPEWLRSDPFVIHIPDKTVFAPQRRIRRVHDIPHLLDCNEQVYPLTDCSRLQLEHLTKGVALLITEHEALTIYPHPGCWFAVAGGKSRCYVAPKQSVDPLGAARELAQFFSGRVVEERTDEA